jgi:RNA polymerase sigma-70 factor (sigma-E family)
MASEAVAEEFSAFVRQHQDRLQRFGYLLTGDSASAEDLTQSALLTALCRWERIGDRSNASAYVRQIMINQRRMNWRRKFRSMEVLSADVPGTATPDFSSGVAANEMLRKALLSMPVRQRTAVILRYYEDLSETDTAEIMHCSVGNVKSQTSRGLARLRKLLPDLEEEYHVDRSS